MKNKSKISKKLLYGILCVAVILTGTACSQNVRNNKSDTVTESIDVMVDWKDLEDPRGSYPKEGTQTGEVKPQIVETKYETTDVVIADIVPTEMGYAIDPTGATDSTAGIQQALYDCYYAGGGTVYLPAGNYAITETITVPQYVTLRGDWQDPDEGTEYGTVISVWMDPSKELSGGAFLLSNSSGVVGVTVYYPFQTLYEVLPYPATFYIGDWSQVITIKDVTVINGYIGIATPSVTAHEILIIENFKGTFLYTGGELNNQADAGRIDGVSVSAKYWKEAAADYMNAPVAEEIDKYVKENTTGFILSDLEWPAISNINIEGCAVGLKFVTGYRIDFVGMLYDVRIKDCEVGILAQGLDERWGMVMASSEIDGGIYNEWIAKIRTTDTKVNGDIEEIREGTIELNDADLSGYKLNYAATYKKPSAHLIVADLEQGADIDVSTELQKLIDRASAEGGGVVYVPGGTYRLDKPVRIPAGVELRGATSVAHREIYKDDIPGTRFMCYYGDEASYNADKDQALITLDGENAGLNGVRIIYPENGAFSEDLNTTYTVRGTASGVYVVNCFIAGSAYGVDFRNCDNHFLKGNYTSCYYNTYLVGGKGGVITGCLHNPSLMVRIKVDGLVDWATVNKELVEVSDPITRKYHQCIIIDGAENQTVYGTFGYGVKNLIVNKDSKNTLVINIGSDNLNAFGGQLVNENGEMTVINTMRHNGHAYDNMNGELKIYNPITVDHADLEQNVIIGRGE